MVSLLPVQTSQCIAVLFFMTGSWHDNVIFSITNPHHSSSCKPGSWELVIPPDSQKRLLYWSSDFKYRWIGFSFSLFSSSLLFLISSSFSWSQETMPTLLLWGKAASSQAGLGWATTERRLSLMLGKTTFGWFLPGMYLFLIVDLKHGIDL